MNSPDRAVFMRLVLGATSCASTWICFASMDGCGSLPMVAETLSDDALERLLENWARWCREHRNWGHCFSVEHKWNSPQTWHDTGEPKSPLMPLDRVAALAVNDAWRGMPEPYKTVLSDWYVYRASPHRTCRVNGLRQSAHAEYVNRAKLMCRNRLTRNGAEGISQFLITADSL